MRILTINPGSTSTKFAVFEDTTPVFHQTIRHSVEDLAPFAKVTDQFEFRKQLVLDALEATGQPLDFAAVVGRGGLLKPIEAGVYEINQEMIREMEHPMRSHACNLGCRIAYDIAAMIPGCRAMMADPGVTDELDDVARLTGSPMLPRITTWHALNQRAIARRHIAEEHAGDGKGYEDLDLIIAHLGGGISVGAHRHGRCVDVNNAFDGEGPFSPERAGSLPAGSLIDLCFSGKYTAEELKLRISGKAGLAAHLGTTDVKTICDRIKGGDAHAQAVMEAMIYQIAKTIASETVPLHGHVDAILLTGGIAYCEWVITRLRRLIDFIAPVYVYPGEDELTALAENGLGALTGRFPLKEYK